MKLHRFTELDNHRAIQKVHDKLGPDAFIYSTRKIPEGVEVLAGTPEVNRADTDDIKVLTEQFDSRLVDKLNYQLQVMEQTIRKLSNQVVTLNQAVVASLEQKKKRNWKLFSFSNLLIKLNKFKKGRYEKQPI